VDSQLGLESTPEEYVAKMVEVFREVKRLLRKDGTLWLNMGDSYASNGQMGQTDEVTGWKHGALENKKRARARGAGINGLKPKDLVGIPWRLAFALQADGWWLRQDIIWAKPNPMPESVRDRCTKSHEYVFLLTKSAKYYYDADAIREPQQQNSLERLKRGWNGNGERGYPHGPQNHIKNYMGKTDEEIVNLPGRNKRSVWFIATSPYKGAHFATYPPKLVEPCILAGSKVGDIVLDPFSGSGTTGEVAIKHGRQYVGIELSPEYIELAKKRLSKVQVKLCP
jgi:DNA modification methylase